MTSWEEGLKPNSEKKKDPGNAAAWLGPFDVPDGAPVVEQIRKS